MIETINKLKNNRMKTGAVASAVTSEHTIRMKKTLGSLNTRAIRSSSEPLRVGLDDIRDVDKRGKRWHPGATRWNEPIDRYESAPAGDRSTDAAAHLALHDPAAAITAPDTDLHQLAREQGMNTDVRRAIFVALMSAADHRDAHVRLRTLRLRKRQEVEVARVLMRCAGAERAYNAFYTLVARRLCGERRLRVAFRFALWDLFGRMGEGGGGGGGGGDDGKGEEEEGMGMRTIVNLARMFGVLIVEGGLGLGVLKVGLSVVFY